MLVVQCNHCWHTRKRPSGKDGYVIQWCCLCLASKHVHTSEVLDEAREFRRLAPIIPYGGV